MRKTKSEGKTVGIFAGIAKFAICSQVCEIRKHFAICSQGCEFGNVVCEFGNVVCEFGNVVCEVSNAVAKLAMRNFAKVLKFFVRSEVRKCTVHVVSEFRNAKFAMRSWQTDCEIRNGCQLIAN